MAAGSRLLHVNTILPSPGNAVRVRFIADDAAGDTATVEGCDRRLQSLLVPLRLHHASGCPAISTVSGTPTVQDIFTFLSAWFAFDRAPTEPLGRARIQDIFAFLNTWFAELSGTGIPARVP